MDDLFEQLERSLPPADHKMCNTCKEVKAANAFSLRRNRAGGLNTKCKECSKGHSTEWYKKQTGSKKEQLLKKHRMSGYLKRHRGRIGRTEAEQFAGSREGYCAICSEFTKLELDHCHDTEKRRGLLCRRCNVLLGMAQDSEAILTHAVHYLRYYKADSNG